MANINQREIIVQALTDILESKKYNNIVLKQILAKNSSLDKSQKGFITQCVNGTLRNLIHIDYIINFYSNTNTTNMKPFIVNLLRSSVYQIKYMDKVPDSAACNEAVNLVKEKGYKNLSGFVNAVLRNIIRNTPEIKYPEKDKNIKTFLSVKYSVPEWLISYWKEEMDYDIIEQICENQNKVPSVSICVNTLKITKTDLIKILQDEEIEVLEDCLTENALKIKKTSDITKKQSFINGYFHVMDESSMLCVNVLEPKENQVVMDVCAAPGGKSFYSSILMGNTGEVYAFDIHEHKLKLIEDTQKRLGITNITKGINNALAFDVQKKETVDVLLVDVPCSGFGMLQKKT